eukprot:4016979-Amphidinium_carterae.1
MAWLPTSWRLVGQTCWQAIGIPPDGVVEQVLPSLSSQRPIVSACCARATPNPHQAHSSSPLLRVFWGVVPIRGADDFYGSHKVLTANTRS